MDVDFSADFFVVQLFSSAHLGRWMKKIDVQKWHCVLVLCSVANKVFADFLKMLPVAPS